MERSCLPRIERIITGWRLPLLGADILPLMRRVAIVLLMALLHLPCARAQLGARQKSFTRADTLRGSIGPERAWWDVTHYEVSVTPDFGSKSIRGTTTITFVATSSGQRMQIDLQQPLVVDSLQFHQSGSVADGSRRARFTRDDNVLWVDLMDTLGPGDQALLTVFYHGTPRSARQPPWDGGWIWKQDSEGNPWMSVACQGLGASVWYPCKDHQSDEPDGAALHITVPDTLVAVGNGRFRNVKDNGQGTSTWTWDVRSPINTYNLVPYIGKYTRLSERYNGLSGTLDIDHWVLSYNADKALAHFTQVPEMLDCFEAWFGPYPFYEDGYKLVESPHLGMEHQSAIAYGNGYVNGYRGMDRSGTGHGLEWDYIIVHESGHEWFGNSITTADIADMWIHEGFTCYSETIFTECQQGRTAANEYLIGLRKSILNDRPLIGPYGVNQEGSVDMYNKGANLIHTIRAIMNDDQRFQGMLIEMNRRFRDAITSSSELESFMSRFSERDLSHVFDQYLRDTRIPVLEWGIRKKKLWYRWTNCADHFEMPVRLYHGDKDLGLFAVSKHWNTDGKKYRGRSRISTDLNWYITARQADGSELKNLGSGR